MSIPIAKALWCPLAQPVVKFTNRSRRVHERARAVTLEKPLNTRLVLGAFGHADNGKHRVNRQYAKNKRDYMHGQCPQL